MSGPSKAQVERLLEHHRGLIARMTEEERKHLRDSFRPEEAVADGALEPAKEQEMLDPFRCANCGRPIETGDPTFTTAVADGEACCSVWCEHEHEDRGCPLEVEWEYRTPDWYEARGIPFLGRSSTNP